MVRSERPARMKLRILMVSFEWILVWFGERDHASSIDGVDNDCIGIMRVRC